MRTLLLFDGIGSTDVNLLPELRDMYTKPENTAFFQAMLDTSDKVSAYLDSSTFTQVCPDGYTLRDWLDQKAGRSADVPQNSFAAGLCVYVHQTCQLQPARHHGNDDVASLGHSIGLPAAMIAGMRLRRMDEFIDLATAFLRLVAVTLARGHQLVATSTAHPADVDRYRARVRRGADPGPMASLSGPHRAELMSMIGAFRPNGSISISLANSPKSHVLSGPAADLLEFYFAHHETFERTGTAWSFLSNTIPFHSPHLAAAARQVDDDRSFIGKLPDGDQLRFPVYATDTPRNLQDSTDLVDEFLEQVLLRPIEWELVTRHAITDAAADRIVDYGPGAAARRFTRECLDSGGRRVRFESRKQSVASPALGGQRAMSTLSRPGRTTQGNGSRPVHPVPRHYGNSG
ncbi:hypothetical protein ACN27F_26890 [Solwaraspora sp. WMMB335]|uniref:hypothetical protein n=1 Tax=Solwaraspora sp. WMMB335 TaxID=3404118 RepID=UPI003B934C19